MKLKDIARTATFAWDSSSSSSSLIATGAVAGALDETFSNESRLEIWQPQFGERQGTVSADGVGVEGSLTINSRFNRLAWSSPTTTYNRGILAAGMETGEINVFDPEKILAGSTVDDARLFTSHRHTGPVRGLDFNPIQKNLLLTGGVNAELFIFDLNNPKNPIPPGTTSMKLDEITSLQWNPTVSRVFAASSSSGFTSVWDLKAQKEIVSLQYGGGAAKGMDVVKGAAGLQMGKRRGMSDVCWHPEQATRLITASEDDESPIIMLWDLRNTRAPERILSGHHKGVLSVAWCRQDADLLLSCGKDNRTLCWNPQTGEIIGELPASTDWSFQTSWSPCNPDLLATASFDGHIGIHSLQTTHSPEQPTNKLGESTSADDIFGALGSREQGDRSADVLSLKQPPKWLRRPISSTFGFGGLLATTSNLSGSTGAHQSSVVHLRTVISEAGVIDRAKVLEGAAGDKDELRDFSIGRAEKRNDAAWRTLHTLFDANTKSELVGLLGFSKEHVARQVKEAIQTSARPEKRDATVPIIGPDDSQGLEGPDTTASADRAEMSPSDLSAASEGTKNTDATEQSMFDEAPGTPGASGADFFSSMAADTLRNPQLDDIVPHKPAETDSSVAATIGSRASSLRSETIKANTFRIYPGGESEIDRLITQALVLGDFASAVDLCLASERFADALLLAVRGGPELLQSTQKAYFTRRTTSLPFLRLFQSIVTDDIVDIVQNADLSEWKVIFAVLCTFCKEGDFDNLADQLGQRLQYRWQTMANSDSPEAQTSAKAAREDATLCYLAASRLEKVVGIWVDEMREEENGPEETRYTAHAHALQSFIEKVAVFTAATGYRDEDLLSPTESAATAAAGTRTYKLAALYDRFYEYADFLATQGLLDMAAVYVKMTPLDYKGTGVAGSELDKARNRLLRAADLGDGMATSICGVGTPTSLASLVHTDKLHGSYPRVQPQQKPGPSTDHSSAPNYPPATSNYAPASNPLAAQTSAQSYNYGAPNAYLAAPAYQTYGSSNGYAATQTRTPSAPFGAVPSSQPSYGPPLRAAGASGSAPSPISVPVSQRRDMPGWNDAPHFAPFKRPQSAARETPKPDPIMSPFPVSSDLTAGVVPTQAQGALHPRIGQPGMLPPPPKGGHRPPSAQAVARAAMPSSIPTDSPSARPSPTTAGPPTVRNPATRGGPPPGVMAGPPPRALSPLGPAGRVASPISAVFRPPPPPAAQGGATRALPSSSGAPTSARIAGPPPPGRRSSALQTSPDLQQSRTEASDTSTATPAKSQHPTGDRSHIPASSYSIYSILSAELERVKQSNLPPHLKRIVDDTERRLNILFDALNNDAVPQNGVDQMNAIAQAMGNRDANAALAMHVDLSTNATGNSTAWVPGVKQLIRLGL